MWPIFTVGILLFVHFTLGQLSNDCTDFSTNGLVARNFQYYRLYDFRHINSSSIAAESASGTRYKTVADPSWENDWYIRNYPRKSPGAPSIPVNFIPERVFMTSETNTTLNYTSYLTFSTARIDEETQEGGEITFKEFNASYASIRVYGRLNGDSGAVAGIFTYLNDTEESDIELFTRAPPEYIQYSNQPSSLGAPTWANIPGATVNKTLPNRKKYTDWHVHRLDWTPGRSVFYVDEQQINTTTLQVPVGNPPSGIYIDLWSANSTWSGSMEVGKSATFDVQWIELVFNVTEQPVSKIKQKICKIGAVDEVAVKQSTGAAIRPSLEMALLMVIRILFILL